MLDQVGRQDVQHVVTCSESQLLPLIESGDYPAQAALVGQFVFSSVQLLVLCELRGTMHQQDNNTSIKYHIVPLRWKCTAVYCVQPDRPAGRAL